MSLLPAGEVKAWKSYFAASILLQDRMHLASVRQIDLHRMSCRPGGGPGASGRRGDEGRRMMDDSKKAKDLRGLRRGDGSKITGSDLQGSDGSWIVEPSPQGVTRQTELPAVH